MTCVEPPAEAVNAVNLLPARGGILGAAEIGGIEGWLAILGMPEPVCRVPARIRRSS